MNNEIKEILHNIKECCDIHKDENWVVYQKDKIYQLLDYITNLRQENKRLKDDIDWWKNRFFGQQEYDDSHKITAIEYKKRIEKAIDKLKRDYYINEHEWNDRIINETLNILQNGSDNY